MTVTGAGFLLNDEMDDFATAPGKPNMYGLVQGEANAIAPGQADALGDDAEHRARPDGQLLLVVGTPGGPRIITMVYHVISNVIDHRMSLPDAVVAPADASPGAARHASRSSAAGSRPRRSTACGRRGHAYRSRGYWGDVEAIIRTPDGLAGRERSAAGRWWRGLLEASGTRRSRSGRARRHDDHAPFARSG